jgi:molybdate transport system substrate-binding protein
VLAGGGFNKLSIADPTAGVAAIQTLSKLGLHDKVAPHIFKGASITFAYDFVRTGAADSRGRDHQVEQLRPLQLRQRRRPAR